MCIWDSYVYQKGVLCFLIHKSYVRSIIIIIIINFFLEELATETQILDILNVGHNLKTFHCRNVLNSS